MDDHPWKITSKPYHEGVCPSCNDAVAVDDASDWTPENEEVAFEELDAIGEAGAENLREKGIVTRGDVKDASDDEILDTAWVGKTGLKSIRSEV
jgi:hypothetical protein